VTGKSGAVNVEITQCCAVQKERRSRPRSFTRFNRYSEENKNYGCSETYADGTPELFNDLRISIGNNEMSRSVPRRLTGFAQRPSSQTRSLDCAQPSMTGFDDHRALLLSAPSLAGTTVL